MTSKSNLFKSLDRSYTFKVTIRNGEFIDVKGNGVFDDDTLLGTKLISDVLFVPETHQNLLSVAQLLEKNYSIVFKDKACVIYDATGCELLYVTMREKSFPLSWKEKELFAYPLIVDENALWHKRLGHYNHATLKYLQ